MCSSTHCFRFLVSQIKQSPMNDVYMWQDLNISSEDVSEGDAWEWYMH